MNPHDSRHEAGPRDRGGPRRCGRTAAVPVRRRHRARRCLLGFAVAVASLVAMALPAQAQPALRIVGAVQWVSATNMAVMTEFGNSITVDLREVDQSVYRGLRTGDRVLIDGTLSPDRRRVIARDIWHDSGRGAWTQAP